MKIPYLPYTMQNEETTMETYVERWAREQKEAAQKEAQKEKSRKRRKAVNEDGTDSRGEGHEAQAESGGGE